MRHSEARRLLAIYSSLNEATRAELARHTEECPQCRMVWEAYQEMDAGLAALPDDAPSSQAGRDFYAAIAEEERRTSERKWRGPEWLRALPRGVAEVAVALLLVAGVLVTLQPWARQGLSPETAIERTVQVETETIERTEMPAARLTAQFIATYEALPSPTPISMPSATPLPTLSAEPAGITGETAPDGDIARLLSEPPAAGELVEIDAYFSGAIRSSKLLLGETIIHAAPNRTGCPASIGNVLSDWPVLPAIQVLDSSENSPLPDDAPWLIAVWHQALELDESVDLHLPYHTRLRGYLGEPAFAECINSERVFVVEEIVTTYEDRLTDSSATALTVLGDYSGWEEYESSDWGFRLRHPEDWTVQWWGDTTWTLLGEQWPQHAVTVQVHAGETHYDQYAGEELPALLQGDSFSVFEQGWSFDTESSGGQNLVGYQVHRFLTLERDAISILFSGNGKTYELTLTYPTGPEKSQYPVTIYTGIVESFALFASQDPTPTPLVKSEVGPGPIMVQEAILPYLQDYIEGGFAVLSAELVSEEDARATATACKTFNGRPDGVWLLDVEHWHLGLTRTARYFLDATNGKKLCAEEIEESDIDDTGYHTYIEPAAGLALDYPAGWYIHIPGNRPFNGFTTVLTSYDPEAWTSGGPVPADRSKIDVTLYQEAYGRTLEDLLDEFKASTTVLSEEQWTLPVGHPALRLQIESELGDGETALLLTIIDDYIVRLVGYGNLEPFDDIAHTLRPRGNAQASSGLTVEEYVVVSEEEDTPSHFEYLERIPADVLETRKAWREPTHEILIERANLMLEPFGYRFSLEDASEDAPEDTLTLYHEDAVVETGLRSLGTVSLSESGDDFLLPASTENGRDILIRAAGVERWDMAKRAFMWPVFVGDDLVFVEGYAGPEFTVKRGDEVLYTCTTTEATVDTPIKGLWSWAGHWVLEVRGDVILDGVSLCEKNGYDEIFGWQLLAGQPLYFFETEGTVHISYAGEVLPYAYDEVWHYWCCEASIFNVQSNDSMVWFHASKDGSWHYVEMGVYE